MCQLMAQRVEPRAYTKFESGRSHSLSRSSRFCGITKRATVALSPDRELPNLHAIHAFRMPTLAWMIYSSILIVCSISCVCDALGSVSRQPQTSAYQHYLGDSAAFPAFEQHTWSGGSSIESPAAEYISNGCPSHGQYCALTALQYSFIKPGVNNIRALSSMCKFTHASKLLKMPNSRISIGNLCFASLSPLFSSSSVMAPFSRPISLKSVLNVKNFSSAPLASGMRKGSSEMPPMHDAYELLSREYVPEYDMLSTVYKHRQSQAKVVNLQVPGEKEKVFAVSFRTPVYNSMGIPHILEHSVLLGSKKYQAKEPFAELLKGSLYTFLNAITFVDHTMYPIASVNEKDYYNLADVYMDAVFNPRAVNDPRILKQEGWHYSVDGNSNLSYKGVVYNEMKGMYSSPSVMMFKYSLMALFKDHPYEFDSGGDPADIPSLTFEKLRDFHNDYYHPSNSKIVFYGTSSISKNLDFSHSFLKDFAPPEKLFNSTIPYQEHIYEPCRYTHKFAADPNQLEDLVTVCWCMDSIKDPKNPAEDDISVQERMELAVLDQLLIGDSSGPLYRALIDSKLGTQLIRNGYNTELKHSIYTVGLRGLKRNDENAVLVESLVLDTLKKVSEDGFSEEAIVSALNTIEFALRERNSDSLPKGLLVIIDMISEWNADRVPLAPFYFENLLRSLRAKLAAGTPVFQDLIKSKFLQNGHRATVHMVGDPDYSKALLEAEEKKLSDYRAALNEADVEQLRKEDEELKEMQLSKDSAEALSAIPMLSLNDLEKETEEIPTKTYVLSNGVPVLSHELKTDGILYTDLVFSLDDFSIEEIPLLTLLCRMITQAGTSSKSEEEVAHLIGTHTGGIKVSLDADTIDSSKKVADACSSRGFLTMRTKCVKDKTSQTYALVSELLTDCDLSNSSRAVTLLKEMLQSLESSIVEHGDKYGAAVILSKGSAAENFSEAVEGVTYLYWLRNLIKTATKDWPAVQKSLEDAREHLLKSGKIVNLTGDKDALDMVKPAVSETPYESLESFLGRLSDTKNPMDVMKPTTPPRWVEGVKDKVMASSKISLAFAMPSQVNYVCLGGRLFNPGERITGSDMVVARSLAISYLWEHVRVVGGAYGSGFKLLKNGMFVFTSYRDPGLLNTLEIYKKTGDFLIEHSESLSDSEVTRAIIGAIRGIDHPYLPDKTGFIGLWQRLIGESKEDRQKFRQEVLATTSEDFKRFGEKLKSILDDPQKVSIAIFGSKEAYEKSIPTAGGAGSMTVTNLFES